MEAQNEKVEDTITTLENETKLRAEGEEEGEGGENEYDYTKITFEKRLTPNDALYFSCLLFFVVGLPQGFTASLDILLMAKGTTYTDQAHLSYMVYPYLTKILIAPFMDSVSN